MLGNLLYPAMEVSDDAFGAQNFFAIELQDDAQYPVSGGMLRPHVDDELVGIEKGLLVVFEFEMGSPVGRFPSSIFPSSSVRSVIARSRSPG